MAARKQPYELQQLLLGKNSGDFVNDINEFTCSADIQAIIVNEECTIEYIHNTSHISYAPSYVSASLPAGFYMGISDNLNLRYFKLSVAGSLTVYY